MKRSNDMSEPAAGSCLDDESFTILLVQAMGSQRQGSHHTNSLENGDTVDGWNPKQPPGMVLKPL